MEQTKKTPFWLFLTALVPPLILVAIATTQSWVPTSQLFRDPLQVAQEVGNDCCHVYFGFFSNLGVLLWCSTASICIFTSMLLIHNKADYRTVLFMISAGLLTGLLLFDDLFQGHEVMYQKIHGVDEIHVFVAYIIFTGLYLTYFRNLIVRNGFPLLIISLFFFAASIFVDLFYPNFEFLKEVNLRLVAEDAAKLIGITAWTVFHFRAAWLLCTENQSNPQEAL